MNTKKTQSIEAASTQPAADAFALTADPLPHGEAPSPPEGYLPRKLGSMFRGSRPAHVQVGLAPLVANELRASQRYDAQFGVGAPDKERVADGLMVAAGWSHQLVKAKAWMEYVRVQEALAWKHATVESEALREPFVIVAARDRKAASEYPATAQYFGVAKARGKRAAATKRSERRKSQSPAETPGGANKPEPVAAVAVAPSAPAPIVNVMNGAPSRA